MSNVERFKDVAARAGRAQRAVDALGAGRPIDERMVKRWLDARYNAETTTPEQRVALYVVHDMLPLSVRLGK